MSVSRLCLPRLEAANSSYSEIFYRAVQSERVFKLRYQEMDMHKSKQGASSYTPLIWIIVGVLVFFVFWIILTKLVKVLK